MADDPCEPRMTNLQRMTGDGEHDGEATENFFNAPLPSYEREWRHPSEISDESAAPIDYGVARSVIRGMVLSTAMISIGLSLAVLHVVTPASTSRDPIAISSSASVDGLEDGTPLPKVARIEGQSTPVLALSKSGFFISSATNLEVGNEIHIVADNGVDLLARVIELDHERGLAWLHAIDETSHKFIAIDDGLAVPTLVRKSSVGDQAWLLNNQQVLPIAIGIASRSPRQPFDMWPINNLGQSIKPGIVVDKHGKMVGLCVEYKQAHWILPTEVILKELHRLELNGE